MTVLGILLIIWRVRKDGEPGMIGLIGIFIVPISIITLIAALTTRPPEPPAPVELAGTCEDALRGFILTQDRRADRRANTGDPRRPDVLPATGMEPPGNPGTPGGHVRHSPPPGTRKGRRNRATRDAQSKPHRYQPHTDDHVRRKVIHHHAGPLEFPHQPGGDR